MAQSAAAGCLPEASGRAVARLIEQGELAKVTPSGWTLESANIELSRLEIRFRNQEGKLIGVMLLAPTEPKLDRSGRWFGYRALVESGSVSAEARRSLLAAAEAVDASFSGSPWIPCSQGVQSPGPVQTRHESWFWPPWAFLMLGALVWAILLAGIAWVFVRAQSVPEGD